MEDMESMGYGGYWLEGVNLEVVGSYLFMCMLHHNSSKFNKEELIPGSPANSNS